MRTKEKARRRVTSVSSLESMDTPTRSAPLEPKNVANVRKRPRSHVPQPARWSYSIAKRPCNSEHATSRNGKTEVQLNLTSEPLSQSVHDVDLTSIRKRKAVDNYRLTEVAQGISLPSAAEVVSFSSETNDVAFGQCGLSGLLAASPTKKLCMSPDSFFFYSFNICCYLLDIDHPSLFKNVVLASTHMTKGEVVAGKPVTEREVQCKSSVYSMQTRSSVPITPITVDKGKQKVSEVYREPTCIPQEKALSPGTCCVPDDARQDFLCMLCFLLFGSRCFFLLK